MNNGTFTLWPINSLSFNYRLYELINNVTMARMWYINELVITLPKVTVWSGDE